MVQRGLSSFRPTEAILEKFRNTKRTFKDLSRFSSVNTANMYIGTPKWGAPIQSVQIAKGM